MHRALRSTPYQPYRAWSGPSCRGARRFHELIDVLCEAKRARPISTATQSRPFHEERMSAGRLTCAEIPMPL
ncbi:hypothetical protein B6U99_03955 [Candidatus Geothermarchaeota archaeon ex4572_27]|nr:MAG: hypothetical protein B6U99_03955 [Candidatus Geothermarchaeota archaeon ex4572_27]